VNRYPKQRLVPPGQLRGAASATSVAMGNDPAGRGCHPPHGGLAAESWDECRLDTHGASVSKARRFVLDRLSRWDLEQDVQDDVVLAVSELVTNAIVHTASIEITCRLGISDGSVYVAIADQGLDPVGPQVRTAAFSETGRGLQLVSALAENWGVILNDGKGRVVWAAFRATQQPRDWCSRSPT
jgi:anti-sigma regulatory factor (Ser/Thr protein kinase)